MTFKRLLKEAVVVVPLIMAGRLFHRRGAEDETAPSPVKSACLRNMKTSDSGGSEGARRWLAHMEEAGDVVR